MSKAPLDADEVAEMDIEFLDCEYESVDLDELAAAGDEGPNTEPAYLGWFIDRSDGASLAADWQRV